MTRLLAKLEDFRLLPFFVLFSMAIGIAIGNALSISDFALTPPIDSVKAIAGGTFEATVPNLVSLGVPIGLFAMMYPAMTNIRLGEVGTAVRSPRQLIVLLAFNYLVAPFVMLILANIFVSDPELHTGLVLYGLAPCIAMVIIFAYLARGNAPMALVFVALNSVIQMLLIPVYARLLIGNVEFDVWVVAESVVLYLGLPLVAIAITAFSPTVALATVVGPLIEVPVMLTLVWAAMRLGPRWFGIKPGEAVPAIATAPAPEPVVS
jgi:ACR3 family arsenite transporter